MAAALFTICAITALTCAWLLLRAFRQSGHRLLFWSGLCFIGLFANNVLLIVDRLVLMTLDLTIYRLAVGLAAMALLVFGLIWEED
jgi:hypothetical protein